MADEEAVIKLKVDPGPAEGKVKSLKAQLKEANAEAAALAEKFGDTSKQAAEAAKKAALLKDTIEDTNARIQAFNPDEKFRAVSQSLTGVASGYAAIQGIQGLIGTNNKDLEKQLLKVQSAMAVADGVNGLLAAKDAFKNLISVIKNAAVVQKVFNFVASMNPIGLIVIAIGALGAAVLAFKNRLVIFEKFAEIGRALVTIFHAVTDAIGLSSEAARELEAQNEKTIASLEKKTAAQKNELEVLRARKASAEEIHKLEQQQYKDQIALLQLKKETAEDQAEIDKLVQEKKINQIAFETSKREEAEAKQKEIDDKKNARNKEAIAKQKAAMQEAVKILRDSQEQAYQLTLTDTQRALRQIDVKHAEELNKLRAHGLNTSKLLKVIADEKAKVLADADKAENEQNQKAQEEEFARRLQAIKDQSLAEQNAIKEAQLAGKLTPEGAENSALEIKRAELQAELDLTTQFALSTSEIKGQILDADLAKQNTTAAAEIQTEKDKEAALAIIREAGFSALQSLTSLVFGESKKAQAISKAITGVQIGIDTASAFSKLMVGSETAAVATGPAYPFTKIAFYASGVAQILANVARAKKLLGGSGPSISGGGVSQSAPLATRAPIQNTATLLDRSGLNNQGQNQLLKAYVVETDVTKVQARIQKLETASKI